MASTFFISYARGDVEIQEYRNTFASFVRELMQRVSIKLPAVDASDLDFEDVKIQTGEVWSERLVAEISGCRVGVVLLSPRYITRRWCGQEFQVLLERMANGPGPSGIVPIVWEPFVGKLPLCVAQIQNNTGAFPPEYFTRGMRRLSALRAVSPVAYEDAMDALASAISAAAEPQRLKLLRANFYWDSVPSAWDVAAATDEKSHTQGSISKTCFVFLSKAGWDWIPYDGSNEKIGALAQKITGEMGLRYEELSCDATLQRKLAETSDNEVPTVIFGDPESLGVAPVAHSLQQYDERYLPNCATLVAWTPEAKTDLDTDPRWTQLRDLKKVKRPPPFHEWRSIFSREELDRKTRTTIEQLRSQILKQIVSEPKGTITVAKATDATLQQNAAARGIDTQLSPQLGAGR